MFKCSCKLCKYMVTKTLYNEWTLIRIVFVCSCFCSKAEFRIDYHAMILVMTKVVQADGQVIVNASSCSWLNSGPTGVVHPCQQAGDVRVLTHETMSSLLFAFLTTVRELRLVPREKELLNRGKKTKETRKKVSVAHQ